MKVLVWSDHHFHNWRQFADRTNGINSRLRRQVDVLEQIKRLCIEHQVAFAIHGGDLFHTVGRLDVDVYNIVCEALQDFPVPLYLVDGNHDLMDRKSPFWFHRSFERLIDGKMIQACPSSADVFGPGGRRLHGLNVLGLGWTEDTDKVIAQLKQSPVDLIVCHKEPIGAKYGGFKFDFGVDWQELSKYTKFLLFGHIHEHQILSETVAVVGAPMAHNFGDIGEHGVMLLDFQPDVVDGIFIPLKSPKFLTVDKLLPEMVTDRHNYYRVLQDGNVHEAAKMPHALLIGNKGEVEERLKGQSIKELLDEYAALQKVSADSLAYGMDVLARSSLSTRPVPKRGWLLKSVQLQNFLSFREAKYILSPGVTIVLGQGDAFSSNGAGKTALFDAIVWGLFGAVLREIGVDDVVHRQVGRDCLVELKLENELTGRQMVIRRSRLHKLEPGLRVQLQDGNESKVYEGGKAGALGAAQQMIEDELGCDRDLFLHVSYFGQEVLRLLGALSDSERQELVSKLLDVEEFDVLREIVKKDIELHKVDVASHDRQLIQFLSKVDFAKQRYLSLEQKLSAAQAQQRVERTQLLDAQERCKYDITLLSEKVQACEERISACDQESHVLEQGSDRSESQRLSDMDREHTSLLISLETRLRQAKTKKERLTQLSGKVGAICEQCGSQISAVVVDKCLDDAICEEKDLQEAVVDVRAKKVGGLQEKLKVDTRVGEALVAISYKKTEYVQEKVKLEKETQVKLQEVARLESSLNQKDTTHTLRDELAGLAIELDELDLKVQETKAKLDLDHQRTAWLDFWLDAFGRRGIVAMLLDRFCNRFNERVGFYAAHLSGGSLQVVLSPQSQLKSGEMRDRLSIRVQLGTPPSWADYGGLSGGEKRRVDLALLFALADVYQQRYGLPHRLLGVLILDEVFGYLDVDGEEAAVDVLQELGQSTTVFVVSHTEALRHYFDTVWTVQKTQGVSRLHTGESQVASLESLETSLLA